MTDFELSEQDKLQGLWLRIKAHLEDRIAAARMRNDAAQSEYETAMIRGEIRCLKSLRALGDPPRPMTGLDQQPP
jgi:hypothetical protein